MLLALLGAEVIKIESRTRIDHSRQRSLAMGAFRGGVNQAPMFNELNLNKLSIQLNLKQQGAKQVVRDLAAASDGGNRQLPPRHARQTRARLRGAAGGTRRHCDGLGQRARRIRPGAQLHRLRADLCRARRARLSLGRAGGTAAHDGRLDRPARWQRGRLRDAHRPALPRSHGPRTVHRRFLPRGDRDAHRRGVPARLAARRRRRAARQRAPRLGSA